AQGTTFYPAFMELVRQQLGREYTALDLTSGGLHVFTTLDPLAQRVVENTLPSELGRIEAANRIPLRSLEGAAIVTSVEGNEVLAMVGGRNARFAGFNRAMNAARPIGSLVKPIVYMTALENPQRYTWTTLVDDVPLEVELPDGQVWVPENYQQRYNGSVPLYRALAESLNVSTVKVGLSMGVAQVVQELQRLGFSRNPNPYPSLLLGAVDMSPLEVTQIYHTLAAGGFRTPLNTIREVLDATGTPLQRYGLEVQQGVESEYVYLVNRLLQLTVDRGTARGVNAILGNNMKVAAKTGTTDDFRDSWFAGFSGDRVAVVWVGKDNNESTGLTGAAGAMRIWGRVMREVAKESFVPVKPETVEEVWIDQSTGARALPSCGTVIQLPFLSGSAPQQAPTCGRQPTQSPSTFQ
ncbi:MAG: penicillin-binding protein 1B, partial [Gammaproteobacteria bacterium]|nr:penicillin-binding protein 1B [Gammaproteobacteria bacterium]